MRKTIFTLNVNHAYPTEITNLTYPLFKYYAKKIGGEFVVLHERKFPGWIEPYEKFQIFEESRRRGVGWNLYFDCDALIHPDTPDITAMLPQDTVCHHGSDFAPIRWRMDNPYFRRDGRFIGSCNWFAVAHSDCADLWHPLEEVTQEEIAKLIFPVKSEREAGYIPVRLLDDYVCSLNIARYGLKFIEARDLFSARKLDSLMFFFHLYAMPYEQKVVELRKKLAEWGYTE